MKVHFTERGWADYQHWITNDQDILERTNVLLESARRDPFRGLGKPEPLKGSFSGWWSRRINGDHRLIYRVEGKSGVDQRIEVGSCRYHYDS